MAYIAGVSEIMESKNSRFIYIILIITLLSAGVFFVSNQITEYKVAHICDNQLNPDDTPLPATVYDSIPAQCVNKTRLYPDEVSIVDLESKVAYIYYEMPELGAACVDYQFTSDNMTYSSTVHCDGEFRGRYVIEDTHRLFETLINRRSE